MKASICVDTARKRNGGTWVGISEMKSKREFLDTISLIHKDEKEPEFLFTDTAAYAVEFHHTWLNEYYIDERVFQTLAHFEDESPEGVEKGKAFLSFITTTEHYEGTFEELLQLHEDRYIGFFESNMEFNDTFGRFMLEEKVESLLPSNLIHYFDYEKWTESEMINSYIADKHGNVWSRK